MPRRRPHRVSSPCLLLFAPLPPLLAIAHWLDSSYLGNIQSPVEPNYSKSSSTSFIFMLRFLSSLVFGTLSCHLLHSVMHSHFQTHSDNIPRKTQLGHALFKSSESLFPSVLQASPSVFLCQLKMMGLFHPVILFISLSHSSDSTLWDFQLKTLL